MRGGGDRTINIKECNNHRRDLKSKDGIGDERSTRDEKSDAWLLDEKDRVLVVLKEMQVSCF